ncbi:MAG: minichromosome maintenance protein MCM [Candidatus Aenigmatarchaeota archaeon]
MVDDVERLEEFFSRFYQRELMDAAATGKKAITVDFNQLDKFDHVLADKLLDSPAEMLPIIADVIAAMDTPYGSLKLVPRFTNLPQESSIRIRSLRSEHIGKLMLIDGIVRRAGEVLPEISVAIFKCPACEKHIEVPQTEKTLKKPFFCDDDECGYKGQFEMIDRKLFDSRWLSLEEPHEVATAEQPGSVHVYMRDDLTTPEMQRKCDAGSRLKVVGIIKEMKDFNKGAMKTQMHIFIEANHVEPTEIEWDEIVVTPEDEEKIKMLASDPQIYDKLVQSIAPSIWGLNVEKEAIAYQLFGGVQRIAADGTRLRGDIHLLLVGDPAVGKTQLLKLVSKVIPRGKYVSGKGVTGVGLTASVTKDEELGGWVLEAGAMVLCHKSLIAIDEFDKMNKDDQIAMHEAMSTQTISIAKATIIATLPSQTAVLAGANPKLQRFDIYRPLPEQIDIPETLLSRFDLKFVLRDVPNKETDTRIAEHIMKVRMAPEEVKPLIPTEMLKKFVAYARWNCRPVLTPEAAERLKSYYLEMRGMWHDTTDSLAITARQQEGLVRLSEAAAKVRLSEKVTIADVERAIRLMEYSLKQLAFDRVTGKIDIDRVEGVGTSKRNAIRTVLDIIDALEKAMGKKLPIVEIITEAQEKGVSAHEVEDIVNNLKREGRLFEVQKDHVQKLW